MDVTTTIPDAARLSRAKAALWHCIARQCGTPIADDNNRDTLIALAHWLSDTPHAHVSAGRGIGLRGPVGTGKTSHKRALGMAMVAGGDNRRHGADNVAGIRVVNSRRIVADYNRTRDDNGRDAGGDAVVIAYANKPGDLCIDDLSLEQTGRHYGKETNVIADIITMRYDLWRGAPAMYGLHITTNASNQDLRERYDERTLSRLTEMVCVLPLDGLDRRSSAAPPVRQVRLFEEVEAPQELTAEEVSQRVADIQATIQQTKEAMRAEAKEARPNTVRKRDPQEVSAEREARINSMIHGRSVAELEARRDELSEQDTDFARAAVTAIDEHITSLIGATSAPIGGSAGTSETPITDEPF